MEHSGRREDLRAQVGQIQKCTEEHDRSPWQEPARPRVLAGGGERGGGGRGAQFDGITDEN